jgi:SpoU rRNA methylase family enzyme
VYSLILDVPWEVIFRSEGKAKNSFLYRFHSLAKVADTGGIAVGYQVMIFVTSGSTSLAQEEGVKDTPMLHRRVVVTLIL